MTDDGAAGGPYEEIELKLAATKAGLERLRRAPLLEERATTAETSSRLVTTYFDTPDLSLTRRGVALRVRRNGRRHVQMIKAGEAHGTAARLEWSVPVRGNRPELDRVIDDGARARLGAVPPEELGPVFTSRVRRRARVVGGGADRIEVAFDDGDVVAGESGREPVAEIELELMAGAPEALYDLAIELHAVEPLRLETRSKAARGFQLVTGEPPRPRKATAVGLERGAPAEEAMAAILRACFAQALANLAPAIDGRDPEGVHQLRVGLRRLRSAFSLFTTLLPADDSAWLREGSRRLAGALGDARDGDVFLDDTLAPVEAAHPGEPGLAVLRATTAEARDRGYAAAREALRDPGTTAFLLRFGGWLEGRRWRAGQTPEATAVLDGPAEALADRLLAHRHKKTLKAGRGFARLDADGRHQVRIACKKLRYAAEFFGPLYPEKATRRFVKRLARLQSDLGRANDLAVARARLEGERNTAESAAGVGLVLGWHGRAAAEREGPLVKEWKAFRKAGPFWG